MHCTSTQHPYISSYATVISLQISERNGNSVNCVVASHCGHEGDEEANRRVSCGTANIWESISSQKLLNSSCAAVARCTIPCKDRTSGIVALPCARKASFIVIVAILYCTVGWE